jgi:rhamnogalacturonyl hydrolase YesR
VSTANGALLALQLYDVTRAERYLTWAERMADWVQRCLRAPNDLFWDHVESDGSLDPTQWSYNQGAMIGVEALLFRATGDTTHLQDAERIAAAAVAHFRPLVDEEPPFFLAIFFRDLLLLEQVDRAASYRDFLQEYADDAWARLRDPHTGLFRFDRTRPVMLLEQAAMVQIYAALAR